MNQLVKFSTSTGEVQLSPEIVREFLVNGDGKVSDQEVTLFMELCKYRNLNPFLKEAHLIKYGEKSPAQIVVSYDVFKNRADINTHNKGYDAGVIVVRNGEVVYRTGALLLNGEELVGGWSEVIRDDRVKPIRVEVSFSEYVQTKSDGTPNKQWREKPAFMIRKVALAQGLREAFPNDLNGLYMEEENAPITSVNETVEVIEFITKDEAMGILKSATEITGDKIKAKELIKKALVNLELRDESISVDDLELSKICKNDLSRIQEEMQKLR